MCTAFVCIDVVGNQWDATSKEALTTEPKLIAELNQQMQLGIYDKIMTEVDRAQMFGGLSGVSDFEAYRAMGKQMYESGAFEPTKTEPVATTKTEVKAKDTARSNKRKAASTPKQAKQTTSNEYNPLSMSDEDLMKLNKLDL